MFHCQLRFLRAHVPIRLLRTCIVSRTLPTRTLHATAIARNDAVNVSDSFSSHQEASEADSRTASHRDATLERLEGLARAHAHSEPPEALQRNQSRSLQTAYATSSHQDPVLRAFMDLPQAAIPHLTSHDLEYVANRAVVSKSKPVLQRIALNFQRLVPAAVQHRFILFLLAQGGSGLLLPSTIHTLLRKLHNLSRTPDFEVKHIVRFSQDVLLPKAHSAADSEELSGAFQTLATTLIKALPNTSAIHPTAVSHISEFTALSHILFRLCHHKRDQQVLEILSAMVRQRKLPASILQQALSSVDATAGPSHETFRKVVTTTLVKAWVQWQMYPAAARLFKTSFPQSATVELGLDILREMIQSTRSTDIEAASEIMCMLMTRITVPRDVVEQFYEQSQVAQWPSAAEKVYQHATNAHSSDAAYLPRGPQLQWLLTWLVAKERNLPLARAFGWELSKNKIEIELPLRGDLIFQLAYAGLALPARVLWEKYSVGEDGKVVTAHRAAMVKLASLFTTLAASPEARKKSEERFRPKKAKRKASLAVLSSNPTDQDADNATTVNEDALNEGGSSTAKEDIVPAANVPNDKFLQDVGTWRPYFASDFMDFAKRVVEAFRETKEPLEEAEHKDLTSLARAYTLIGQRSLALRVLQVGTIRKELPDMYDVNVALAAVAQQKPREAARMLRRMHSKGLKPDRYSIGPIVNHAVKQNDMALVNWLVSWVRWENSRSNTNSLDAASVDAILRGVLQNRKNGAQDHLHKTWDLTWSLAKGGVLPTLSTGKKCVESALEAGGPGLAYLFWRTLVRDRDGPTESDTRRLRGRIAVAVGMAVKEGTMRSAVGRRLLEKLSHERGGRRRYGYQHR